MCVSPGQPSDCTHTARGAVGQGRVSRVVTGGRGRTTARERALRSHGDVFSIDGVPGRAHDEGVCALHGPVIRQGLPLARPRARRARRARAANVDPTALAVGGSHVLVGRRGFGSIGGLRGHVPEARSLRVTALWL